ncbi:tyrosine-protein phosphatase [Phycisphaerales bacterium AB-hyl4]|uniref:protein-tyrosine-phosphatase n=1 Tax=Natronomicrosphaera hydrolytica TaxID=3242702 RepID=A0ABV4U268_9BACT
MLHQFCSSASRPEPDPQNPLPPHRVGRIDIHCHLIPGVDDGCKTPEQTCECIRQLQRVGYTGSICTPHIWPDLFPDNDMPRIRQWTAQLQKHLDHVGLDYQLWPGGELRLFDGVIDWLEENEPPTLAGSRFVLLDFWESQWSRWIDDAFDWLIERDYQPILAHPERLGLDDLPRHLDSLQSRGVRLQGNFRCLTGEEGPQAEKWIRQFLAEGRYQLLAMDAHRPDTLASRIAGLEVARQCYDADDIDRKTIDLPRQVILGIDG